MKRFLILATLLSLAIGAPALAQVPSTFSYQGVLTDAAGNLVPDGLYTITFRIYNVAVAGAPLYVEAHPGTLVQKGGFSLIVGNLVPIALPFDVQYWLGIQVNADPELVPRVPLASSPYSLSLRLPFTGTATSASPAFWIRNLGGGPAIVADPFLAVGTTANTGLLQIFKAGVGSPIVESSDYFGFGGYLHGSDNVGSATWQLEPDADGSGGFFIMLRDAAFSPGFFVNGNLFGSNQPFVGVWGSTQQVNFDMTSTGDFSVQLPGDAISSGEMLNEPGVASETSNGFVALDGTYKTILSRTINCPTAGYLLALATCQANINHTAGLQENAEYGLSLTAGSLPANQDVGIGISSGAGGGFYFQTPAVNSVFPVNAGLNTVYFIGHDVNGTGAHSCNDMQLSIAFFPTAYGTVTAPAASAPMSMTEEMNQLQNAPITEATVAAERQQAEQFNADRMQKELDAIRAQLSRVQAQMTAVNKKATVAPQK